MKMSQQEIEKYCREFLKDNYNLELSIPVKINPRLSSTLGRFVHYDGWGSPLHLEFSKKFLTSGKDKDIIDVLRHECIHYALYVLKKPFIDGEKYFEDELIKHGVPSTDVINFLTERYVRVYSCKCKEHVFLQTIAARYCLKCDSDLVYVGRRKQLA